jgi:peroxiredoxin Q/BCP
MEVGDKFPSYVLPDENGETFDSKQMKGKRYVIYFYPKDNTSGCTRQAIGFSEKVSDFEALGMTVIGVSKDSVASHKKFEEKYGLPFTLLSDTELEVIKAYDVWKEKKNYGKVPWAL